MSEIICKKRRNSPATRAYWREQVAAWRGSGLSQAAYCRREAVSASSLGLWVRRLAREQIDENAAPVIVAVSPRQLAPAIPDASPEFAPLRLHVGERFRVDIAGDFPAPALRKLLHVLLDCEQSA